MMATKKATVKKGAAKKDTVKAASKTTKKAVAKKAKKEAPPKGN